MPQNDISTSTVKENKDSNALWYTSRVISSFALVTIYPLEAFKKWAQRGYPQGNFHPYKGVGSFAANIVPTTIFQRSLADGYAEKHVTDNNPIHTRLAAAALCGVIPATTATVVENCVTIQQELACANKPSKPQDAFKEMFRHRGYLGPLRSYPCIAVRDGIFTSCVDVVCPETEKFLSKNLMGYFPNSKERVNTASHYSAYLGVGFVGAALSHPFDTIGTNLQKSLQPKSYKDAFNYVLSMPLNKDKGIWYNPQNFYRGFWFRFGLFSFFLGINQIRKDLVEPRVRSCFEHFNKNTQTRPELESKPKQFTPSYSTPRDSVASNVSEVGPNLGQPAKTQKNNLSFS